MRVAVAGSGWLAVAVMLVGMCTLPAWLRGLMIVGVLMTGGFSLARQALLRGSRALRAVEWSEGHGGFVIFLGPGWRALAAEAEGCRRFGPRLWRLRFRTAEGRVDALLDTGRQEPRALRRLAGRLFGPSSRPAGPVPAAGLPQAATIPAKV